MWKKEIDKVESLKRIKTQSQNNFANQSSYISDDTKNEEAE